MPIYMDFHRYEPSTIQDGKNGHLPDLAIQHQYGVKYHQYWINEEAGTVLCLMEGPDKATCAKVHRLTHHNAACALTEVEAGFSCLAMGLNSKTPNGLTNYPKTINMGVVTALTVAIRGLPPSDHQKDPPQLSLSTWAIDIILSHFGKFSGNRINWDKDDRLMGVFEDSSAALGCAHAIHRDLQKGNLTHHPQVNFKIGLSAGQSDRTEGDPFHKTILLSNLLSHAAGNNQVVVASLIKKHCIDHPLLAESHIKFLPPKEEDFLFHLLSTIEDNLANEAFTIRELCQKIGISRPQLYRKVHSITGRSPNCFLRDLRLERALTLLQQKAGNVAQVAYDVGFNSPGYFTRAFKQRFGVLPHCCIQ